MQSFYRMKNVIQHYPWGSTELIPGLLGIENRNKEPYAELWMGVHSRGPSKVFVEGRPVELEKEIARHPGELIGREAQDRFGDTLPFLFKVLAAARPLSIQAHPNREQAQEGFERENREGIPVDAPHRNYRDRNHKPEVLCALTHFTALCGFRTPEEVAENFNALKSIPAANMEGIIAPLLHPGDKPPLEGFFHALMEADEEVQSSLIEAALSWAEQGGSVEAALIRKFHSYFGNDIGVLSPLYLNVVNLAPGQALYQPAGVLHAYVEGMGVELMANSDNVLRGGLTSKHVDVPELMRVLDFSPRRPDIIDPQQVESGREQYPVPIDEFALLRLSADTDIQAVLQRRSSLEIGVCTKGNFALQIEDHGNSSRPQRRKRSIGKGESFVIPYGVQSYTLSGSGEIYFATVPRQGGG